MSQINKAKRVYLLTYSQEDLHSFPTRQYFEESCANIFAKESGRVLHYVFCLEDNQDGGKYYHYCLKLSLPKKWTAPRQYLHLNYGIHKNIEEIESGEFYSQAYRYICKTDTNVYLNNDHLLLKKLGSSATN